MGERKREREKCLSFSPYKASSPIGNFTILTSFNLNYLLKIQSPNAVTLDVSASTYKCRKDTNPLIKLVIIGKTVLRTGVSKP